MGGVAAGISLYATGAPAHIDLMWNIEYAVCCSRAVVLGCLWVQRLLSWRLALQTLLCSVVYEVECFFPSISLQDGLVVGTMQ